MTLRVPTPQIFNASVTYREIYPEDFGVSAHSLDTVVGGSAADRALKFQNALKGEKGPHRDFIVINGGAGLYASGITKSLLEGAKMVNDIR